MSTLTFRVGQKGSSTSGNYMHAGRHGKVGGSAPRRAVADMLIDVSAAQQDYGNFDNWAKDHQQDIDNLVEQGYLKANTRKLRDGSTLTRYSITDKGQNQLWYGEDVNVDQRDGYKRFAIYDAGRSTLSSWDEAAKPTQDEIAARREYQGDGYLQINGSLRHENNLTEQTSKWVSDLDNLISRSTVKENVVTYRGISSKALTNMGDAAVGKVLVDKGFVSTSLNSSEGIQFAGFYNMFKKDNPNGALIEVKIKAGTHATFMVGEESEVLLPRDSKFLITGMRTARMQPLTSKDTRAPKVPIYTVELVP